MTEQDAARRLLDALDAPDELACADAEELLPALVEAEQAGEDVDQASDYALLLAHLDHCPTCLELYEQLSADLETLFGPTETLPPPTAAPPTFFPPPIAKGDHVLLRLLKDVWRGFELTLAVPRLAPALPTLGGGSQKALFSDTLREVEGAPFVAVSVGPREGGLVLRAAVRVPGSQDRWQIELITADTRLHAITDERGIAQFDLPADAALRDLTLRCIALPAAEQQQ